MTDHDCKECPAHIVDPPLPTGQHHISSPSTSDSDSASESTSTSDSISRIIRSSAGTLAGLLSLSQTATVLLFTPVVIPAGTRKPESNDNTDPFESLGRFIADYHKRVRHVPYVPGIGFTSTHAAFLAQADVVLVVTCRPCSHSVSKNILHQVEFAQGVVEARDGDKTAARGLPTVWIQFGSNEDTQHDDVAAFDTVVRSEKYSLRSGRQVAHLLFEPSREC